MKRLLSLLVAGLVFISSVPAYATGRGNESQATPSVREATPLDPQIAAAFDRGEELVPVIVYMKEFPQLEGSGSLLKNREPEQFNRVIDALKSVTDRSQQPLRQALNREILAGKAASVESYFSANALSLKAAKSVVEAIAARPDVSKVIYDRIVPLEKPRIQKSADKAHHQKTPTSSGTSLEWARIFFGRKALPGKASSSASSIPVWMATIRPWLENGRDTARRTGVIIGWTPWMEKNFHTMRARFLMERTAPGLFWDPKKTAPIKSALLQALDGLPPRRLALKEEPWARS